MHLSPIGSFRHAGPSRACPERVCVLAQQSEGATRYTGSGQKPEQPMPALVTGPLLFTCGGCNSVRGFAGEIACVGCGLGKGDKPAPFTTNAYPRAVA